MDNSYKSKKQSNDAFFEGWYFKHQNLNETLSFIVGVNRDEKGAGSAFIQILTDNESYNVIYPFSEFKKLKNRLAIKVGKCYFTDRGIFLDIKNKNVYIKGKIRYGDICPLKSHIMGPYRYLPKMECSHDIISMRHDLSGHVVLNSKKYCFDNGKGYIEKDSGHSFPSKYTWVQSNSFLETDCSVMAAVAVIPFMNGYFNGTICSILYKGKQYKLATYLGAKIECCNEKIINIRQRKYRLVIKLSDAKGQKLYAPSKGNMSKEIKERPSTTARFYFYKKDKLIFDLTSHQTSYEIV